MKGTQHKFHSLDGLRGCAALVVVLSHYITLFAPFLVGAEIARQQNRLAGVTLQSSGAANFAVCIFFVLSGFVLSLSFFKYKTTDVLVSSAARRYFRLMLPAFGSVILIYLVMALGGMYAHQAAGLSGSSWFSLFWQFPANLFGALFQGLYGVFASGFTAQEFLSSYNPVLWTMHLELIGSFLVFLFLAAFGSFKNRWLFYAVFMLVLMNSYYWAFLAGIAIADIYLNYPAVKERISSNVMWLLTPFALVLGAYPLSKTLYPMLPSAVREHTFTSLADFGVFIHIVAAVVLMTAVLKLSLLSKLLSIKPMQYLGRISFSLYLTHLVVLGSLASWLYLHFQPRFGDVYGAVLTFIPSILVTFAVATIYTKYVDVPSIAISKKAGSFLLNFNPMKALRKLRRRSRQVVPLESDDQASAGLMPAED